MLETVQEHWTEEVIHGQASTVTDSTQGKPEAGKGICSSCSEALAAPVSPTQESTGEHPIIVRPRTKEEPQQGTAMRLGDPSVIASVEKPSSARSNSGSRTNRCTKRGSLSIEQAIQNYLQDQRNHNRRPKTVEWHQMALGLLQHYLLSECYLTLLSQITETELQGWFEFLSEQPTSQGTLRTRGTIASYLRSARAFCRWSVRHTALEQSPFVHLPLLKAEAPLLQLLEPEEWEGLLLACRPPGEPDVQGELATVRNQAILWVLADTGMRVPEVCGLRFSDVDRERGILMVQEKEGARQRRLPLGQQGRQALFAYLDRRDSDLVGVVNQRTICEEALFLSATGHPLTPNGISLFFGRLRKRAGIMRKGVDPSLLRDTFVVQYLLAGGDLCLLQELLGREESASVKRFLQMRNERQCRMGTVL
ncbi:MAG: tyrosine-type recombinase/integrase [Ktedonobacteraceae bacterium]|nr:tyrosine-type recombinase/integrase [Ktedonobacteraceae bacterium]